MFTGLTDNIAKIVERRISAGSGKLSLLPEKPLSNPCPGESIAVNGACLTLEKHHKDGTVEFHTLEDTLKRTNLGAIPTGGRVNIERALMTGARLGGHFVTGHIDASARFIGMKKVGGDFEYRVELPQQLAPFVVPKGCIAIDGVSLTLVDVGQDSFSVHLIPTTLAETCLGDRRPGDQVNIEADLLGKYVWRQLSLIGADRTSSLTMDMLKKAGW